MSLQGVIPIRSSLNGFDSVLHIRQGLCHLHPKKRKMTLVQDIMGVCAFFAGVHSVSI
jgi:hypothetical protein